MVRRARLNDEAPVGRRHFVKKLELELTYEDRRQVGLRAERLYYMGTVQIAHVRWHDDGSMSLFAFPGRGMLVKSFDEAVERIVSQLEGRS